MFDELKVFVTVAETKSFTRAAKKLNFSQPAISQQIKRLEIYFRNAPLLLRSANSRSIELTEQGRLVYEHGKEILALLDRINDELDRSGAGAPLLRVGASMTIGAHLLPSLLRQLHDRRPRLLPHVYIGNTRQICDKLDSGEIDIGLIEGKTMYYNDFLREDFYTDPMVLVASPAVAEGCRGFSPSALGKATWIVREQGSGTEQYLQAFLESNRIRIENRIECNSNEANCELVKQGLGVTFISRLVVDRELRAGELVQLPANRACSRRLSYIVREDRALEPDIRLFVEVLQACGAAQPAPAE